jgi:acetyl esterase/lipase
MVEMSRYEHDRLEKSYTDDMTLSSIVEEHAMTAYATLETDVRIPTSDQGMLDATLYRPAEPAIAAVLDVHGGAWTSGDRTMNAVIARHLATNGIAVLALEFRMPPAAAYPATLTDLAAGIRWLKSHAADLGTDASRVGILGTSSGGHLALLTALRPNDARYTGTTTNGEHDVTVPFAVACWPVSDPHARYRMVRERANQKLVDAHHAFWADEAAMIEGSPVDIVTRGDAQHIPPILIVQGTQDDNLTPDMQQRFANAYAARGGSADLVIYDGEAHGFIARDPTSPASCAALVRITQFITHTAGAQPSKPNLTAP